MTPDSPPPQAPAPPSKAGLAQVMSTMFWALCMIGKKGTWERNGATLAMGQVIVGGLITTIIVIGLLILLVKFAVSKP
jgi:hypothetical protein